LPFECGIASTLAHAGGHGFGIDARALQRLAEARLHRIIIEARELVLAQVGSGTRPRRSPATRKIDIRVNALERQEEGLIDCGVDPAHVIRAALRRAVKNWELGPNFIPPAEEQRTRITEWRARTSLAVDAGAVTALLRAHDPLDVLSKWTLIRGQLEPRVWAEIDTILSDLEARAVHQDGS